MRLITGTPEALEEALAAEVRERRESDPLAPIGVLIGGTLQRPYLQRRLADLCDGIVNVHFLTQSDLALALGERRLTLDGKRPLPPLADRILLREIAGEHEGYFEPVRDAPGFADALFQLVRELRGAGYDAESFAAGVEGTCEAEGKDTALAEIFSTFLERRQDFYGPDDCLLAADVDEPPFTALAVHGVWDPPDALSQALAALAKEIPITTYLPLTGTDSDAIHAGFRSWLADRGAEETSLDGHTDPKSTLAAAKSNLFRDPADAGPAPDPDGSIRLISGPDPHREVREVARTVLAWAQEGVRFHEIAIAYRHADTYRPVIEAVFGEAGVPIYLHEGTPLAERPIGRRALALIDLVGSDLERRAVMDFLTDSHLPKKTREEYDVSPTRWDRFSRAAGVVEGLEQWKARLAAFQDDRAESEHDWRRKEGEDAERLSRFVTDLASALRDHEDEAPWGTHLQALERLLRRYLDDPDPILDPLQGLARFDALGGTTTYGRFLEVVRGAIETLRSEEVLGRRPGAFGRRGVNVLDVNSLRLLGFRAVAVVGLAERSFPPAPRQTPLLLDEERVRVSERGGRRVPQRAMGPDPEPLQFALAVSAARERLLLSYPRKSGGEARPQLPSYFYRAAAAAVTGERVSAAEVDELPPALYSRAKGSRIGAATLDVALSPSERDRTLVEQDRVLGRAILSEAEPRIAWAFAARDARFERKLTPYDGVIGTDGQDALEELLTGNYSPSSLETYAACPQRYFLGNIVGAKRLTEPEATIRISPLDKGTLIHKILERFLLKPPADGEELLFGAGERDRLLAIADEEFKGCEERGETGYPLIWHYERDEIREDLTRWLEAEREDPTFRELPEGDYEIRFGRPWDRTEAGSKLTRDEPLEITANGVELRVAGRIDRLNWNEDTSQFRVVDYKTGKVSRDLKEGGTLLGGRALQLPIYLLVGAELTGIPPERGSAEYHHPTRRGGYARRAFTGEKLNERRDELNQLIAGIVTGINSGSFLMAPEDEWDCKYCDFDRVCPTARRHQIRAKENSRPARAFAKLREIK